MFIVFIVLCLIGIALIIAGILNLRRTARPLAYVAVVGGVVLGALGLILLTLVL